MSAKSDAKHYLSESAREAAEAGAVKAACEIGSGVAEQVRNAVTGTIAGVKVVLKERK
jgi:hypothetical protein